MALNEKFLSLLKEKNIKIFTDYCLAPHTTMKTGGNADYFALPSAIKELTFLIDACKEFKLPFMVMGNGSNLLISDKGVRKMVIATTDMKNISLENNLICAQAGARLGKIGQFVLDKELEGFEFASGIPGTIGGGVYMNAGAYEEELSGVVSSVNYYENGDIKTLSNADCGFSYRRSIFIENKNIIILSADISLKKGDRAKISAKMKTLMEKRREKQPLEYPSSGSTFKRPAGHFAGKLIEDAGLAGFQIGGAKVSEKHCGFIINAGNATSLDVLMLIQTVKDRVFEKFNVTLEPEVQIVEE